MSIWTAIAEIGGTAEAPDGSVLAYADGYSNHYPTEDFESPASIGLAEVPSWCVPGAPPGLEDGGPGPWLRVHFLTHGAIANGATVVLTPEAAGELASALLRWANRDHTQPKEVS